MASTNPAPPADDPAKIREFEARIARGETIEPKDWMPERYRRQLVRMMSQHAHSEVVGMLPEGNWVTRAPNLRRKMSLLAKVQDEAGHGLYIYCGTETLGVDRGTLIGQLLDGIGEIFEHLQLSHAHLGRHRCIGWFVDGAAIVNQTMLAKASYGPYARAMVRICKEENFHKRQGYEIMATLAAGTPAQRAMAQDAVNRWWWPSLMMFGPSDKDSPNSAELMRWGVKHKTNDELRQRFVNLTVAQAKAIDVTLPDPDAEATIRRRTTGSFGPIDWERVLACGKGRRLRVIANVSRRGVRRTTKARGSAKRRATPTPPSAQKPANARGERRFAVAALGSVRAAAQGRAARARGQRARRDGGAGAENARDVYARRGEAVSIWVVPSDAITRRARRMWARSSIRGTTSPTGIRSSTRFRAAF